jgi:hypothetical protein
MPVIFPDFVAWNLTVDDFREKRRHMGYS